VALGRIATWMDIQQHGATQYYVNCIAATRKIDRGDEERVPKLAWPEPPRGL